MARKWWTLITVSIATFMLPVMDVGSPAGDPVYVTVLDRHVPERRLTR